MKLDEFLKQDDKPKESKQDIKITELKKTAELINDVVSPAKTLKINKLKFNKVEESRNVSRDAVKPPTTQQSNLHKNQSIQECQVTTKKQQEAQQTVAHKQTAQLQISHSEQVTKKQPIKPQVDNTARQTSHLISNASNQASRQQIESSISTSTQQNKSSSNNAEIVEKMFRKSGTDPKYKHLWFEKFKETYLQVQKLKKLNKKVNYQMDKITRGKFAFKDETTIEFLSEMDISDKSSSELLKINWKI